MERATGSSFEAERLVALGLAQRIITDHGLSWADLLYAEAPPLTAHPVRTFRDCAREILTDHQHVLTDWEESFLQSIIIRTWSLSPKQEIKLRQLCDRYGVAVWAGVP